MSRRPSASFEDVTDGILAEVRSTSRIKTAELEAVRAATPSHATEIGQLLHKVAEELRTSPPDVTYEDLHRFLNGGL